MSLEKPLAGSNPMLHFQIRPPSTGVRPPTTLFHGLLMARIRFSRGISDNIVPSLRSTPFASAYHAFLNTSIGVAGSVVIVSLGASPSGVSLESLNKGHLYS